MQIRRDARINWITKPVHKRREARGLTSIGKQVSSTVFFYMWQPFINLPHSTEPWSRQGSPLQPHSGLVDLEEAQHPQPPPLPVICRCICSVMHSVSFSIYHTLRTHVLSCSLWMYATVQLAKRGYRLLYCPPLIRTCWSL